MNQQEQGWRQRLNQIFQHLRSSLPHPLVGKAGREITERQVIEQQLDKINRTLRLLSECNQTVVRAANESELLTRICRLIVELGGYAQAWVDLNGQERAAWAGDGPPGNALSLPLVAAGQTLGALNIVLADRSAFEPEESQLLHELAGDLAYGLHTLRTRAALQASEERFRVLVESMNDIVYMLDREQRHVGVFGSWVERSGLTPQHFLGKTAREIVGAEAAPIHEAANRRALAGESVVYEWSAEGPAGQVYYQTCVSPIHDAQGQVTGLVGVGRDITNRIRLEENLKRARQEWEEIFQAIGHPTLILDPQHTILAANRGAAQAIGKTAQELTGKKCWEVFHKSDAPPACCPLVRLLVTNQMETAEMEVEALEGVYLVSCTPVRDKQGRLDKIIHIATDITQRRRAEAALRERQARLQSIFRAAPVGIGLVRQRILVDVNERICEMIGYSREELVGQSARILYPTDEDYEFVGREKYAQIAQRGTGTVETRWQRKDGTIINILLSSTPLEPGDLAGEVTFTALDITERVRAEQELECRANEFATLYETARDLATQHDLPTLLQTIVARAARLLNAPSGAIFLYDTARQQVELAYGYNFPLERGLRLDLGQGQAGRVASSRQPLIIDDYSAWEHRIPQAAANLFRASLEVPMLAGGEMIGVLDVSELDQSTRRFTEADARLLSLFATQAAIAIENTRLLETARALYEQAQLNAQELENFFGCSLDLLCIADTDGYFHRLNREWERVLGYRLDELEGQRLLDFVHPDDVEATLAAMDELAAQKQVLNFTNRYRCKDGNYRWLEWRSFPSGKRIYAAARDITDRVRAEEKLLALLQEKETLLAEVHHRVKNNLQVIISLLKLQAADIQDEKARAAFVESQNRVRAMALIHERLYQAPDLARFDLAAYIRELANGLFHAYITSPAQITLEVNVQNVRLELDQAVSCGLLLNELLANSLKHAFPDGRAGRVRVELYPQNDQIVLVVADDGIGLPPELDPETSPTLGLQLVYTLATHDLGGEIELNRASGTCFKITFHM